MNLTQGPLRKTGLALASLLILLGILSIPWRAERPAAPPAVAGVAAGHGPLRAGVATRSVELGPAPTIGGFPRWAWRAEGVAHPISARALVVEAPGCAVAIASAEILLVPEPLAAAVRARLADLHLSAVVVTATHTHAGPGGYWDSLPGRFGATGPYDQATFDRLADALAGAVRAAHAALAPAEVAVARGRLLALVRSRTAAAADGRLLSLRLSRPTGTPVAELLSYAAHPTLLGKANRQVSGDWVGPLLDEAPLGPRLFVQGALGDQSVRLPPAPATEQVAFFARTLSAFDAGLPPSSVDAAPALAVASATVPLPRLQVMAVPAPLRPAVTTLAGATFPAEATVTAVRLGEALLLFTPGEPVEAVGRAWRQAAGAGAEVLSLADGYVGYVDTAARVEAGEGEARRSYYGPALAERLGAAVVAAANAADRAAGAGP